MDRQCQFCARAGRAGNGRTAQSGTGAGHRPRWDRRPCAWVRGRGHPAALYSGRGRRRSIGRPSADPRDGSPTMHGARLGAHGTCAPAPACMPSRSSRVWPGQPRANAIVERFHGSVRREGQDHVLLLGEQHLHQVLCAYTAYFNQAGPHQGLQQAIPRPRTDTRVGGAPRSIRAVPSLSGLHRDYQRAAWRLDAFLVLGGTIHGYARQPAACSGVLDCTGTRSRGGRLLKQAAAIPAPFCCSRAHLCAARRYASAAGPAANLAQPVQPRIRHLPAFNRCRAYARRREARRSFAALSRTRGSRTAGSSPLHRGSADCDGDARPSTARCRHRSSSDAAGRQHTSIRARHRCTWRQHPALAAPHPRDSIVTHTSPVEY